MRGVSTEAYQCKIVFQTSHSWHHRGKSCYKLPRYLEPGISWRPGFGYAKAHVMLHLLLLLVSRHKRDLCPPSTCRNDRQLTWQHLSCHYCQVLASQTQRQHLAYFPSWSCHSDQERPDTGGMSCSTLLEERKQPYCCFQSKNIVWYGRKQSLCFLWWSPKRWRRQGVLYHACRNVHNWN